MKQQSLFAQRMKQKKEQQQNNNQPQNPFPTTFKVDIPNQSSRAQFHGLSEQEYQKIDSENIKAIQEMNEQQILDLQKEIKESLGDKLYSMFLSGDIYQRKQQQQMQLEINQNITKNTEIFSQIIQDDHIVIAEIQELIKSPELSSVKIALSKIDKIISLKNSLHLETIRISEYLISVGKSTNLSISLQAFEVLYKYWTLIVPDCWNQIYNSKQLKENEDTYIDLPIMLNQLQYSIQYSQALDLLRIRNILCQSSTKYQIEEKSIINIDCKLKSIILQQQFEQLTQINFLNITYTDNVIKLLIQYNSYLNDSQCNIILSETSKLPQSQLKQALLNQYQNRFNCKLIHDIQQQPNKIIIKPKILDDLSIYEFIPFQSVLIDISDGIVLNLNENINEYLKIILSLIFEIRLQAKYIISKKSRKEHKWRILNIIRVTFQDFFKNEVNKRVTIIENNKKYQLLELIRQQLQIEFQIQNEQTLSFESSLYLGLYQFLHQKSYDISIVQQYIDNFNEVDIEIKPEFLLLKLYKLLISDKQLPQNIINLYSYLLNNIDIEKLSQLLNKNVSYFEKLLQKCQYDSFYDSIYVNTLFLFISPYFQPDFHSLLFIEFINTPILQYLKSELYLNHINYFIKQPQKGLDNYKSNVLSLDSQNKFINQWQQIVKDW